MEAMNSELLIQNIKREINSLMALYAAGVPGGTKIGEKLESLELSSEIKEEVLNLIQQAITESTYNLICGLEGTASLAGSQETYTITDEAGNKLSGNLDNLFYEQAME